MGGKQRERNTEQLPPACPDGGSSPQTSGVRVPLRPGQGRACGFHVFPKWKQWTKTRDSVDAADRINCNGRGGTLSLTHRQSTQLPPLRAAELSEGLHPHGSRPAEPHSSQNAAFPHKYGA